MSMLEAELRGGTVAILLLVAIAFLRDSGRTPAGRNSALFLLSAVGYVICSAPGVASLETPLGLSLLAVSLGHPALFWIWAAATFDDEFKPSWRRGFAWLGLVALGMWSLLDSQPIVGFAYHALSLLFVGLAAWHALAGMEADLVEGRRRLRVLLALSVAAYGAVLIVAESVWPGSSASAPSASSTPLVSPRRRSLSPYCGLASGTKRPPFLRLLPTNGPRHASRRLQLDPWISKRRHFWRRCAS